MCKEEKSSSPNKTNKMTTLNSLSLAGVRPNSMQAAVSGTPRPYLPILSRAKSATDLSLILLD